MRTNRGWLRQWVVGLVLLLLPSLAMAEAKMQTEDWANNDEAFAKFSERVGQFNNRNLLARENVKASCNNIDAVTLEMLADGEAGERCEEGRVFIGGRPTVITYYLGAAKAIKEVGLFTFNGDSRANQDFEIRFADNSAKPGVRPSFPAKPDLTSGPAVLGKNGGGFHAFFRDAAGGDLCPKADWVEVRIWGCYSVEAGKPAHSAHAGQESTYVEIEVLGPESDVVVVSPEARDLRRRILAAPKKPAWEKKAAWRETYLAARRALLEWETLQDELALPGSGAAFGPWQLVGPVDEKDAGTVERQRNIDFAKPIKLKDRELSWQKRGELPDGRLVDLSDLKAKPGQAVFLCREVKISHAFNRKAPFAIGLGLANATLRFLPSGPGLHFSADDRIVPNARSMELNIQPGTYHLMVRLNVGDDGRCAMWFLPQPAGNRPGAGDVNSRIARRENLLEEIKRLFPDPADQVRIGWEQADSLWIKFERGAMSSYRKFLTDWSGDDIWFLPAQYRGAIEDRLKNLDKDLAVEPAAVQARVRAWVETFKPAVAAAPDAPALHERYEALCIVQEALAEFHRIDSIRLAVEDQKTTFGAQYPRADEYLARVSALAKRMEGLWTAALAGQPAALADVLALRADEEKAAREILLANPLLAFEKLLLIRGGPGFNSNWGGPNHLGNELVVLSPVKPEGNLTTIYRGTISDMDLNWDGQRLLFSDGRMLRELNVEQALADATAAGNKPAAPPLRVIADPPAPLSHYDGCYLPDGNILFISTACEQAVPCTGQKDVGNLHLMDAQGQNERRLTFDQDHDWNPVVLNNGRVLYTRWEYEDTPHYFTRLLFQMNPDGTNQGEYYGSNSYWPNAMYWPRPIPGHPTAVVCIVSGHHGVAREGELTVLDPARGRQEADGAVCRIPGRGKKVDPVIKDGLVSESWPRFAAPWPLGDEPTGRGGGKYFLVSCRMTPRSPWGLYLVDVFDNMTPLLMGGYSMPIPLRPRPMPPVIPSKVNLERKDATVYMVNVYEGGGLKGYPKGSIKALRIGSYNYRFPGNGDTYASSMDGGWDVKKILGTVPVYEDGSALFRVPANMPIFVQPLDREGRAQQLMRSWFTAMPGETLSCVGCHERQNKTPSVGAGTMALQRGAVDIAPWNGPLRGFSFDREVQPVLDKNCVGCHNPAAKASPGGKIPPDLTAKRLHASYSGRYSPAYLSLHPYVRRAGYEADYHLASPAEFEAQTSPLVQQLLRGHHNVQLTPEEWDRLYTWIDLNIPYPATWGESHQPPAQELVDRRTAFKKKYAFFDDQEEKAPPLPPVATYQAPAPEGPAPAPLQLAGWPLTAERAAALQKETKLEPLTLDLGEGVTMTLAPVPAGSFVMGDAQGAPNERPQAVVAVDKLFYLGTLEVTNEQYARFDPAHDSGYMDARGKDRFTRGFAVNEPRQPVIRVSWDEAMNFCRWLSKKTGRTCTLPTESQWEWACRAGTDTPYSFGLAKPLRNDLGNFADGTLGSWAWGRVEPGYSDGARFSEAGGRYKPNAWGLYDMHGNVAEWCRTTYAPYPYVASDGREDEKPGTPKVVRGGSWNDLLTDGKSSSRWRYPSCQPVYNVGFRVLVEAK